MEPTSAHLPAGSAASQPLPPPAALGGGSVSGPFPPPSCLFWLRVRACLMENETKEVIS